MTERRGQYPKEEHLKSKKQIDFLFKKGQLAKAYPIRAVYQWVDRIEGDKHIKAGVSVSKRKFKNAVDRNKVKRVMREALRYQKLIHESLWKEEDKTLLIMFIYGSDEFLPLKKMDKCFAKCFKKIDMGRSQQT